MRVKAEKYELWAEDTEGVRVVRWNSARRQVGSGVTCGCVHVSTGAPLDVSSEEEQDSSEEQEEGVRDSVLRALEQRLARAGKKGTNDKKESSKAARVRVDKGMTPVPRSLAVRIKRGDFVDFVDFADLPPAKPDEGRTRKHYDPQVVIWKESDYSKAARKVPDMTTWTRCFLLYEGLRLQVHPERQSDLRSYHDLMARMAQKYEWSACEEYDRRFREQVEGDDAREWADTDPGLFAEYVSAFALEKQTKGDSSRRGPPGPLGGPKKRFREASGAEAEQARAEAGVPICQKFNKYKGDCKYGTRCRFQHICGRCRGLHPISQCAEMQRAN